MSHSDNKIYHKNNNKEVNIIRQKLRQVMSQITQKKNKIALVCSVEFVNYFSYFKINVMNVQIAQNNPKVFNNSSWAYLTIPKQAINGKIPQMFCN